MTTSDVARRAAPIDIKKQRRVGESIVSLVLTACGIISVLTTAGIIFVLGREALKFFAADEVTLVGFLTGTRWAPEGGLFGIAPLVTATLTTSAIAMLVAIPIGLAAAIYLSEYASPRAARVLKPVLELLAGVPTVVYGYFAFVSSMADDSIAAVPQAMRDGSLAMGATKSETIRKVLIPAALPGIVAGVMLAISRAIGETMIVYMAAGAAARLSANPFDSMTTVTYQIVRLLTGDQEFNSPKTLSAFALGLVLFVITLILNIVALRVVKRFREAYD